MAEVFIEEAEKIIAGLRRRHSMNP
jgi:hypothetical protein